MYGEPHGHDLRHGEVVSTQARRTRHGHYAVSRLRVLAGPTGPVVGQMTAEPGQAYRLARLVNRVSFVLTAMLALWVAFVLVGIVF